MYGHQAWFRITVQMDKGTHEFKWAPRHYVLCSRSERDMADSKTEFTSKVPYAQFLLCPGFAYTWLRVQPPMVTGFFFLKWRIWHRGAFRLCPLWVLMIRSSDWDTAELKECLPITKTNSHAFSTTGSTFYLFFPILLGNSPTWFFSYYLTRKHAWHLLSLYVEPST